MTDPMIDPYGDDSDLMSDSSGAPSNSMQSALENPLLDSIAEVCDNTTNVAKIMSSPLNEENSNIEAEALVYAVINLVGEEKFNQYLDIARHRQRVAIWDQMNQVFNELYQRETLKKLGEYESDRIAAVVARTTITTLKELSERCFNIHTSIYNTKKKDYDEGLINQSRFTFNFWNSKAPRILSYLRHRIRKTELLEKTVHENLH